MAKPVSEEEKMAIIEAIKEGKTRNSIAKEFKRSGSTISEIAKENNLSFDRSPTKKATEAANKWNKVRRFELIGKFFDKLRDVIQVTSDPRELKDLSTALGIVIDKARLEEGEPTEITKNENNDTISGTLAHLSTEELKAEIDKLRRIRNANP
jgi:hypothetical protein